MTEEQKEKYRAFVSEISEILGLGKSVDVIKLCVVTDRFFKPLQNQIKQLQEENAKLEAQIEKMKCCMNCVSYHKDNEYPCNIGNNECSFNHNCCDCWELKVVEQEE